MCVIDGTNPRETDAAVLYKMEINRFIGKRIPAVSNWNYHQATFDLNRYRFEFLNSVFYLVNFFPIRNRLRISTRNVRQTRYVHSTMFTVGQSWSFFLRHISCAHDCYFFEGTMLWSLLCSIISNHVYRVGCECTSFTRKSLWRNNNIITVIVTIVVQLLLVLELLHYNLLFSTLINVGGENPTL